MNGSSTPASRATPDAAAPPPPEAIGSRFDSLLVRDYSLDPASPVTGLYQKAKRGQWDPSFDIDWTVDGQIERARTAADPAHALGFARTAVFARMAPREREEYGHAHLGWTISQFLHVEQGAMLCAAKLVQSAPTLDAKCFAATQVVDEARHTEVYTRYLRDKVQWEFPINEHLRHLLDLALSDSRWDFTFLGMQVVIEGLALAAFHIQYALTKDPLLQQITRYLLADEARHVAFGVLALRDAYQHLSDAELRERQEFCYECVSRMRERFMAREVWEALGLPVDQCVEAMRDDPAQIEYRRALFSRVVPNVRRLGLLDLRDGWLRERFERLGVLSFETLEDSSSDFEQMALDHAPWSVVQYKHY